MKVYLSGGMHTGWQERVKCVAGVEFIDPCGHKLLNARKYAPADLIGVNSADMVFAYMEADNPSGFGLSLEVGYAVGRGIPVVFVDEKNDPRMAIVREVATLCLPSLSSGLQFLEACGRMEASNV
jgi:nucleoside 2-deoxyribosyltransferase